jgi:hypothetical protein
VKRVFLAIALFEALSCSESSGPNILGSMTFTYTGGGGGTFSASGDAPSLTAPPTATSWAVGFVGEGGTEVGASKPRSGGLVDLAVLRFQRQTVGSVNIDANCDIDGDVNCNGMILFLNFNGNGDTGDFFCGLTTGTIALIEAPMGRFKGTFSGTGNCVAGTGGAVTAFTVTNGTFDVALVAPPS